MTNPNGIVLGVDLDEVVFQYIEGFRTWLRERRNIEAPSGMPPFYSFAESGWFETEEEFKRLHGEAVAEDLYRFLTPVEGAIDTLWELSDAGYTLNIVTSRFVNPGQHWKVVTSTAESLEHHNVPHHNLSFMKDKTLQRSHLYIDDSPHNIKALGDAGIPIVIFDVPYNRHLEGDRVTNWQDLRIYIKEKFGY